MRTIPQSQIGHALLDLFNESSPLEEDIGIIDEQGEIVGVIITKDAYAFFLRKVAEAEDAMDRASVKRFLACKDSEDTIDAETLKKQLGAETTEGQQK